MKLDIKLIATNDIHYVNKEDAKYQDILLCVQTISYFDDENRMRMNADEFYQKSEHEMRQLFKDYPDAIDNSIEIANKCDVTLISLAICRAFILLMARLTLSISESYASQA